MEDVRRASADVEVERQEKAALLEQVSLSLAFFPPENNLAPAMIRCLLTEVSYTLFARR